MKEILTQLFGEAVTDEALKTFNAELGKKFVAKTDFNAKSEEIKTLKAEKQSLEEIRIGEIEEEFSFCKQNMRMFCAQLPI